MIVAERDAIAVVRPEGYRPVDGDLGEFFFKNASVLLPVIGTAAAAYLTGRFGRKVKLKVDDLELEAASVEEIERLLMLAATYHDKKKSDVEKHKPAQSD